MIKLKFKSDTLKCFNKSIFYNFFLFFFLSYIYKISKHLSANYFQENKERLQKKDCERYQNFSVDEKEIKQQHGCKGFKNLSEDQKKNLVGYRNKYYRVRKKALL